MDAQEFERVVDEQFDRCKSVLLNKAQEYATEDRLHNFKVAAGLRECTPQEALAGMMAKHTVSVYDLCKKDDFSVEWDLWNEKLTDHINYLLLLRAVVLDGRSNLSQPAPVEREPKTSGTILSISPTSLHGNHPWPGGAVPCSK